MNLFSHLSLLQKPKTPAVDLPAAGVYHFLRQTEEEKSRLHLRFDADGSGLLIINANRVFQLNPTAAAMMFFALSETPA